MRQSFSPDRALARARVDMTAGAAPSVARIIGVSVLAIVISLGADAGIVKLATVMYPTIRGFSHFRLTDYGALTALGVIGACAAWSVVLRITSSPRWFFFRLAVIVMLVLWVPDLWLLLKHEPTKAVLVLMVMHLAVALITYNVLVHFATGKVDAREQAESGAAAALSSIEAVHVGVTLTPVEKQSVRAVGRYVWVSMMIAVTVELLVGLSEIAFVPFNRPDGWYATQGEFLSLFHALLGAALGLGAIWIFTRTLHSGRLERIAGCTGFIGVVVGAIGGVLTYDRSFRLWGMGLMFLGIAVAFFGYFVPLIGDSPHSPPGGSP